MLVLGWEYPPAVAGGLGAACHGLTTALADRGHAIQLAVPAGDGAQPPLPHPGVTRVLLGGEAAADGTPGVDGLDPYATDDHVAATSDAPERDRGARASASARLYGGDLAAAIRAYTRDAVARLEGRDFDVVHAHDWMTFPAAMRLRLLHRRPVCLHVHSTAFDRGGAARSDGTVSSVERAGVRTADRIAAVSDYTRSVLVREYGAEPSRVRVVHNAATIGPEQAAPSCRDPERPTVLFVGRLTRQKGVGFLLRAASRVLERRPEVRFVLVGDGEERASLVELAASLGIARRVFFAGSVDDAARDRAYREADVFVLSSISEPFGLTPLEALQNGAATILSDACGVREVLPSAPVVAPWDAAGLADEILRLLGDAALREGLVARGRSELGALTWDRSAEALEAVLRESIDASSAVMPPAAMPSAGPGAIR
ncbi:MAG: glycosyltransferase family 4 protein [Planctomycetota bacterium]